MKCVFLKLKPTYRFHLIAKLGCYLKRGQVLIIRVGNDVQILNPWLEVDRVKDYPLRTEYEIKDIDDEDDELVIQRKPSRDDRSAASLPKRGR